MKTSSVVNPCAFICCLKKALDAYLPSCDWEGEINEVGSIVIIPPDQTLIINRRLSYTGNLHENADLNDKDYLQRVLAEHAAIVASAIDPAEKEKICAWEIADMRIQKTFFEFKFLYGLKD